MKKAKGSDPKYADAYDYAESLGELASKALTSCITEDKLTNGILYPNIGERIIPDVLERVHEKSEDFNTVVSNSVNSRSRVGMKPQKTDFKKYKAVDLSRAASHESSKDKKNLLGEPIITNAIANVDDHIRQQADFHSRAGLSPQIPWVSGGNCCKWCNSLAGRNDYYFRINSDVFMRHSNCCCIVEYWSGNGKR